MRFLAYLLAIVVLFALADQSVAQDRYSGSEAPGSAPPARTAGLRLLTWPGKVAPSELSARVGPPAVSAQSAARVETPAPALPTSIYQAPAAAKPATPAPSAPALAQAGQPRGAYPSARFYSLHRAYGQEPDPVPLGAQFFAANAPDLAAPPPLPPRTVTTTGGRIERVGPADPGAADAPAP
jgi:hypothetical protein